MIVWSNYFLEGHSRDHITDNKVVLSSFSHFKTLSLLCSHFLLHSGMVLWYLHSFIIITSKNLINLLFFSVILKSDLNPSKLVTPIIHVFCSGSTGMWREKVIFEILYLLSEVSCDVVSVRSINASVFVFMKKKLFDVVTFIL